MWEILKDSDVLVGTHQDSDIAENYQMGGTMKNYYPYHKRPMVVTL